MAGAGLFNDVGALTWTELRCRDLHAARDFYNKLFGWTCTRQEDMGPIEYWTFELEGRSICGMMSMTGMPDDMAAHWNPIVGIESAERAVELTKAAGGTVAHGPAETPFGLCVVVQDPQGAWITLVQPPAQGWNS